MVAGDLVNTAALELVEATGDGSPRAESRELFQQLGATRWLERAAAPAGTEIAVS